MISQVVVDFIQVVCICTVIKTITEIIIPENKNFQIVSVAVNIVITFEIVQKLISILHFAF